MIRWCSTLSEELTPKKKKNGNTKYWQKCEETAQLIYWDCKMVQSFWERVCWFFIPEKENLYHTKTCVWLLIAAWFILAQTCKHLKSSTVNDWTSWNIQTMEYYWAIKMKQPRWIAKELFLMKTASLKRLHTA